VATVRRVLFRVAWTLAWPIRTYLRLTPAHRGRGLLQLLLVRLVLPLAPDEFLAGLPGGGAISLRYRERIGLSTLLYGAFEAPETELLRALARPGSTAVDAGANVGVFTIPLALAVGEAGRVLAFEPSPETVRRLRENVRRNRLENVSVFDSALGAARGTTTLALADDAAYNSTMWSTPSSGASAQVPLERLDDVWATLGRPQVSVLKVDVEGAEVDVLVGAVELLRTSRPAVLVEAAERSRVEAVSRVLTENGYRLTPAPGLQTWNLLFLPSEQPAPLPDAVLT
jgi:FkbM family methyltransferase